MSEKKLYVGIADAHGIESFFPEAEANKMAFALQLRVQANRQRHTVLYGAMLTEEERDEIVALLKEQKFEIALLKIKEFSPEIRVENDMQAKSWDMIPNPALDPWC